MDVFLSIPPKYHWVVPPYPISTSETIGPAFFKELQGPIAPHNLRSLEQNNSIFAATAIFKSLF